MIHLFVCLVPLLFGVSRVTGQQPAKPDEPGVQPAPQADPADFGLLLPDAEPKPGEDRRVLVKSPSDELVVAKTLVEVGDRLVVILPDGRLSAVVARDATPTDRKFEPAKTDDIARSPIEKTFTGFKKRTTKRYLYIYDASETFVKATSTILETMYPALFAYCKRQKIAVHDPDVPLVVIMFHTQDEFDKFHKMPEGVVAYYNGVTNYVVMYEQSKLVEMAPDLAVKQSISTIAHEGVHQVLHNIGVQQRLSNWPMWISEGLPEYFAPTSVGRGVRWKGVGKPNDLRMKELEAFFKDGSSGGELTAPTIEAERLDSKGYAAAWALTHFLAERRQGPLFSLLKEVSGRGPLAHFTESQNVELFRKHFADDFAILDSQIAKHLQKLPYEDPIANQTHYVVMMQGGGLRGYIITTSPKAAKDWQQDQSSKQPASIFVVQAFANARAAELFAKSWLGK
ncbi:MAG TPA: DUF1570 domain-containing protein [Pirellulales bacterium]|nr:DUF1570 domain-containing protein [Pirellulales bacterium]